MYKLKNYVFKVQWSEEDQEYVGTCDGFPRLSHLDKDQSKAFDGIVTLVDEILNDPEFEHEDIHYNQDMPRYIYAYERFESGTGTWIDFDDSYENDKATRYIREDLINK